MSADATSSPPTPKTPKSLTLTVSSFFLFIDLSKGVPPNDGAVMAGSVSLRYVYAKFNGGGFIKSNKSY